MSGILYTILVIWGLFLMLFPLREFGLLVVRFTNEVGAATAATTLNYWRFLW